MSFNPCCCWSLKDGCVTVGIWSLIFSVTQLGILGWQTAAIKWYKDRAANRLLPAYAGTYDTYDQRFPGYYERYYESAEEQFYTALFVVQILCLIAAFFLLFAAVALIYGVHTNSRHLVWPWFPCMVACILTSLAYCITWWCGELTGYWLVLTIIEAVMILINIYCLLAVIVMYRRITSGVADAKEPHYYANSAKATRVYFDNGDYNVKSVLDQHYNSQGHLNQAYAPDQDYRQKPSPVPINEYPQEPYQTSSLPYPQHAQQAPPIQQKFPISDEPPVLVPHEVVHPSPPKLSNSVTQLQWQEGVMLTPDQEPNTTQEHLHRAASAGDLVEEERRRSKYKHRKEKDEHRRRHRSSEGRSRRSSPDYEDEDAKSRQSRRHHRRHSSRSHSRSHSRGPPPAYSDSDTGYSRSETSKRHRHRHRRHRDSDDEEDRKSRRSHSSRKERRRGVREVKREDAERTGTASTAQAVPKSPVPGGPGQGITIPQHIVIPPTAKAQGGKPQRFHINSEITISYSDRSTPNPSNNSDSAPETHPRRTSPSALRSTRGPTIEPLTSPNEDEDEPANLSRGSNHGSTAV